MSAKQVDAFIVELGTIRPETAELAIKHRLPSSGPRAWPSTGGLIGYSGNLVEMNRKPARHGEAHSPAGERHRRRASGGRGRQGNEQGQGEAGERERR